MTKTMRPRDVRSDHDILRMESDNAPREADRWSILNGGNFVSIHAPDGGGFVQIPKDQFDAIVDWYMAPQIFSSTPSGE